MKFSLKLQDDYLQQQRSQRPPLLKAKVPITIFNQPFTTSLTTATSATSQDLSFSLSTNFSSGPSFIITYSPISTATTTTMPPAAPFSLSLKSGLGLFGSPHDSPLVFSAHFSPSSTNPSTISPSFLLHFKPQFGHFSLYKTTSSTNPNPRRSESPSVGSPSNSEFVNGSISNESLGWQDLKLEPYSSHENEFRNVSPSSLDGVGSSDGNGFVKERVLVLKDGKRGGLLSGISMKAKTVLPVTKRVKLNLRWGVNLPSDLVTMPYLTVNKIGIESVEKVEEVNKMNFESNAGDMELLKGMCFWTRRDLELLEKENRDMKQCLEDMRRSYCGGSDINGEKVSPSSNDSFGESERRRGKRNVKVTLA